ncbi:M23 family metallopeptidase [Chengkuizengella sediminis]|uniref:M23 family metallopeptidase n=1 Tax=Chengkuizengella sediminis TaxID=1885917 RepID=UPI0013898B73|nr:M23 family metallopeptidase [Chengkuizengella sediminis]NDI34027.1 M23 family metallopeptidase [Chengkuizengella sediminis]
MKINNNVKQRRNQRVNELIQKQKQPLNSNEMNKRYLQEFVDQKLDDPEYVWKHRQDPWAHLKQYDREESFFQKYFMTTFTISFLLFIIIWLLFQLETPWAEKGKMLVTQVINEETFDNKALLTLYDQMFEGYPSFIPTFNSEKKTIPAEKVNTSQIKNIHHPANGKIISAFESTKSGVTIKTRKNEPIIALDQGRVISVENTEFTGLTIVIQHVNKLQSIYGYVTYSSLKVNDWVEGGEQIGVVSELQNDEAGILYFALRKDNQFIDPAEVIHFD